MRRDAEIGEDGQGEPPTPAKTTSSSLKVAGGGGRAAAEPVGPRWPPARPVLTGALLLGAYMPRCSGGARPTGGSALAKLAVLRGSPPGQGRAPPRLAGGSGGRRRSRLVLGGGGGGGSAAAAGGRDGSGGRRERERSGCARGGARWQQVSRRPPSPGCHLPPARDRRGCPGGTVGRSAGEGCGDGGWGEPGGGGRTGRVSSRLAATSGLAASPGGRRRGGTGDRQPFLQKPARLSWHRDRPRWRTQNGARPPPFLRPSPPSPGGKTHGKMAQAASVGSARP